MATHMKAEKIILSFIAVVAGLLVATISFYFYQSTKTVPSPAQRIIAIIPTATPTPISGIFLNIDQPEQESATDKRIIMITGKTVTDATVIVITDTDNLVITPSDTGTFSTSVNLMQGENRITVLSIAPNGQEIQKTITITSSTEDF